MRYLYVLLVLSLAALLWAVLAIARHIKRHDAQTGALEAEPTAPPEASRSVAETGPALHAGDARDSRRNDL